ncbi:MULTISPECIES: ABC transporter permease [unclassified Rhizobium]|uniref:ABC transporter permease n=1 Tax=unclassified Rhizobium TaxID=2613769 RepID=UPI0010525F9A|nr:MULTISPECIES: ABC transporter permease [unclassified Rhizobium]MBB3397040.1 simple sugar transport system permease protein/ribose transport system permease protein [Rhizobium sp. BK060]MBB4170733.1 simple sugar transport system permease protein/ribose transport system permease protein [Rhizobium sp. BK538]TCM75996.1 monosaccharide ABC transporter membrane protein (CUT2 family) [Rhizobium sp. BK068]
MKHLLRNQGLGAIVGVVVMFAAFTVIDFSGWWTVQTISNVTQFTAILAFVAMGQALIIMTREIDLSVGSVYGLTGVAFITMEPALGVPGSLVLALVIAVVAGLIQGIAVVKGQLPSMIVTLGGLFTARGIIYVWTGGSVHNFSPDARSHALTLLLGGSLFGVEAAIYWLILVAAVLAFVLWATPFGNRLLATGGSRESAESRGVQTDRIKIATFILCSLLAGFAGILTLCNQPQTHVTLGENMELEAIAAAVIGGCLLTGGRGSILGAILGALIVVSLRYELIALGAPSSWYITFVGAVLIIAIIFNQKLARFLGHSV